MMRPYRLANFKNKGKDQEELRCRHRATTVELRKNKREEIFCKRRNLVNKDDETDKEGTLPNPETLQKIVQMASDPTHPEQQLSAVQTARKLLLSDKNPPINELIHSGILPILVECLKCTDFPLLQIEAASALTYIASGATEQTHQVVVAGAVPHFVKMLSSPIPNVCDQAVFALGNIIGDCPQLRDYAIMQGVMQPLFAFLNQNVPVSVLRNVTWVISYLCLNKEPCIPIPAVHEILPALSRLIWHDDVVVLTNAILAISYICDGGNERIQLVIDQDIIPRLVSLMGHFESGVQESALQALGTIVKGSDEQTQVVLNHNILLYFPALLQHPQEGIRKTAICFLSNVTAGNQEQVQIVINHGLLPMIIEKLSKGELEIKKEAAWTVGNMIITGNRNQIFTFIREGGIPPFCDLLSCEDPKIITSVLNGINNILIMSDDHAREVAHLIEECGGVQKIAILQYQENPDISEIAHGIINYLQMLVAVS